MSKNVFITFKIFMSLSALLFCIAVTAEETISFKDITCKPLPGAYNIKQGKKYLGRVQLWGKYRKDINKLKVWTENNKLLIDTRAFHNDNPKGEVSFTRHLEDVRPGEKISACVQANSLSENHDGRFFFTGRKKDDKHFHQKSKMKWSKEIQDSQFSMVIPHDAKSLYFRISVYQPGVYEITSLSFSYPKPIKLNTSKNQLTNGGAERGTYNVYPCNQYNQVCDSAPELTVDSRNAASGKYAFCLTMPKALDKGKHFPFNFNPVHFYAGKPITFSCRIKSNKPVSARAWLCPIMNGYAGKIITQTKDWKTLTVVVPRVGSRNFTGTDTILTHTIRPERYAELPDGGNLIMPRITIGVSEKNAGAKVWIDDAVVNYAKKGATPVPEKIACSGKLNNADGYYKAGEPVSGKMLFDGSVAEASINYKLIDGFGNTIKTFPGKKLKLPHQMEFSIQPPPELRGPVNLEFLAEGKDFSQKTGLYFGIIDNPAKGKNNRQFGVNISLVGAKKNDVDYLLPLLRDFHIGAVRIWQKGMQNNGAFKFAHKFKDQNIFTMICLAVPNNQRILFMLKDYSSYLQGIKPHVIALKGIVDAYEIFNEPNIWAGRKKNPDPTKYREANIPAVVDGVKAIGEFLRKTAPKAIIVGPACCGVKADYINEFLRLGGGKYINVLSVHGYDVVEDPDYIVKLNDLEKTIKKYHKNLPVYDTENAARSAYVYPDNLIPLSVIKSAAHDIRHAVMAIASGVEINFQFTLYGFLTGSDYGAGLVAADHINGGKALPGPYLYASRAVGDILLNAKPAGRVKMGIDYLCFLFDRGDKRIAALWKWNGSPLQATLPEAFDQMNMYGTRQRSGKLLLSEYPVFLETGMTKAELTKKLQQIVKGSKVNNPVTVIAGLKDDKNALLQIQNRTSSNLSGTVILYAGNKECSRENFSNVPAEETLKLAMPLNKTIGLKPEVFRVETKIPTLKYKASSNFKLYGMTVPYTKAKLKIDGNLNDWPENARTVKLGINDSYKKCQWTEAEKKINAELKLAWNMDRFYIGVTVYKDGCNPSTISPAGLWQGDSLQIAFDTIQNATAKTLKYQDDDIEYSMGLFKGSPIVYRHVTSSDKYDSLHKPTGIVNDVDFSVKTMPGKTVYEIALPRFAVSPFQLAQGSSCRFNMIINLNNGKQRIGWLQLAPGMGVTPQRPGLFMPMILTK